MFRTVDSSVGLGKGDSGTLTRGWSRESRWKTALRKSHMRLFLVTYNTTTRVTGINGKIYILKTSSCYGSNEDKIN